MGSKEQPVKYSQHASMRHVSFIGSFGLFGQLHSDSNNNCLKSKQALHFFFYLVLQGLRPQPPVPSGEVLRSHVHPIVAHRITPLPPHFQKVLLQQADLLYEGSFRGLVVLVFVFGPFLVERVKFIGYFFELLADIFGDEAAVLLVVGVGVGGVELLYHLLHAPEHVLFLDDPERLILEHLKHPVEDQTTALNELFGLELLGLLVHCQLLTCFKLSGLIKIRVIHSSAWWPFLFSFSLRSFSNKSFHSLVRYLHICSSLIFCSLVSESFLMRWEIQTRVRGNSVQASILVDSCISRTRFSSFMDSTTPVSSNLLILRRQFSISHGFTLSIYNHYLSGRHYSNCSRAPRLGCSLE